MVRGRAAAAARGGVLSLCHRMVFSALACGVRAKDDGAIGILSITHRHTNKIGFNHVEGSKTARVAALAFFSPISGGAAERAGGEKKRGPTNK